MGKFSRFLKSLFTFKSHKDKPQHNVNNTFEGSVTRPRHTPRHRHHHYYSSELKDEHSVNHVAAEVVRMMSRTTVFVGDDYGVHGEWAAVNIQACFRGYLARKALRALKALVKLQALVRGDLLRKQVADYLRRIEAMVGERPRSRACRIQTTESPQSATKVKGPPTPEKFEHVQRSRIFKHNQSSMLKNNSSKLYHEHNEKFLEVDPSRTHTRRRSLFQQDQVSYSHSHSLTNSRGSTINPLCLSPSSSYEVTSITAPLKYFGHDIEEQVSLSTAQYSPPFYPNGMRMSPFNPAKSDSSRSCLSGYSDHPNYMAYTESSLAKVRSVSAPRQRPNLEIPGTTKRYSVYGYGSAAQRGSNMRDSFASKAYPGSGRLDRLGMPIGVGFRESDFSGGYWN